MINRLRIKLYPYHTFLFTLFIVLFLRANNPGQVQAYMTYRTLLLGTAFTLALYGLFYFFLKSRLKAGVVVTFILFSLFQYGVIYEFFESLYYKGYWPLNNIHRYQVSFYILLYLAVGWLMKRSSHDFIKINYFLNALIILLICFNSVRICLPGQTASKPLTAGNREERETMVTFAAGQAKPDIFYIVLDGYAANSTLLRYFGFSNSAFTSSLEQQGFYFCDSAYSNYYYTYPSLATTLNYSYPDSSSHESEQIQNNRLFSVLKQNGYEIWHMKSGYAVTGFFSQADHTIDISGPNEFEKNLFKYTILRLDDLIGVFAHQRLKSQFRNMNEMSAAGPVPRFCFVHIVAPHPPFIFDRQGRMRTSQRFAEHSWEPKEHYIDQLIYVNSQILGFIASLRRVNPTAAIVLQSDHGPWIKAQTREEVFEARSQILYAAHLPGQAKIPSRTSSVNTFRYVLNTLFHCRLDTLPDLAAGKKRLMEDPILLKKTESE